MVKQQLFIGAALIVGVAAGYFVRPAEKSAEVTETEEFTPAKAIPDEGEVASIRALKARIAQLEAELAKKDVAPTQAPSQTEERINAQGNRPRGNPREWMENLKKENPERYTQMTNGMARFRQMRVERQQAKLDFFSSIDVSGMSHEAQKTHNELQNMIAKRDELEREIMNENLSDERRGEIMREIFESSGQIRELSRQERDNLLNETAKTLGLDENTAKEFSDTVREIYEATDDSIGGPGRGPGRRGGRQRSR